MQQEREPMPPSPLLHSSPTDKRFQLGFLGGRVKTKGFLSRNVGDVYESTFEKGFFKCNMVENHLFVCVLCVVCMCVCLGARMCVLSKSSS